MKYFIEKIGIISENEGKFVISTSLIKFKLGIFKDLEIFENIAYIMAYHADKSIPNTIEDWLDDFEMFSIYEVLPEILELWGANIVTDVSSKKTFKK